LKNSLTVREMTDYLLHAPLSGRIAIAEARLGNGAEEFERLGCVLFESLYDVAVADAIDVGGVISEMLVTLWAN
jgi:hypothetical protein